VDLSSLNLRENIEKSREFKADAFAAQALAAAMKGTGGGVEAQMAAMTLVMCLSSWSFNLSKERLLDNFGATALNRPSVFWDKGNSHPNMELRILTIMHLLTGSQTSAELLDDFLTHRKAGSKEPQILWQKP
jgi:Zn-dependent protease with chaperone function